MSKASIVEGVEGTQAYGETVAATSCRPPQRVQARMHPALCLAPNTVTAERCSVDAKKTEGPTVGRRVGWLARWELAGKWPLAADRYDLLRKDFPAGQIAASVRFTNGGIVMHPAPATCFRG